MKNNEQFLIAGDTKRFSYYIVGTKYQCNLSIKDKLSEKEFFLQDLTRKQALDLIDQRQRFNLGWGNSL
jgi:hypothetical protein